MGLVVDYYKVGRAAATIVDRHQKGEELQNIPVQQVYKTETILMLNKTTSDALNFKIPKALLGKAIILN